jgi:hypothetical protein
MSEFVSILVFKTKMMTILGCPEKRGKTHATLSEPSFTAECSKKKALHSVSVTQW